MSTLHIRDAHVADSELILHFVRELARYEKAEQEVIATRSDIEASIFGEQSTVRALICEADGQPIGFAVYFFNYSTWQGRRGLYLEDLYVSPEYRGGGAGKALLKHLARIAVDGGCGRFEWSVLDWNEPAIGFYEKLGAERLEGWYIYRLSEDALKRLGPDG